MRNSHDDGRTADILDSLPEIVFECDRSGRLIFVNQRACDMLGYAMDELLAISVFDLIREDDRRAAKTVMTRILDSARDYVGIETCLVAKTGSSVSVQVYTNRILDETGAVSGIRGIAVDTTGIRTAIARLAESEEKYRKLVEYANDIIYQCNYRGDFLEMNQFGLRNLDYTLEELRKKNYTDLIPAEFRDREYAFYSEQLRSKSEVPTYRELPLVRKDGTVLWVAQHVSLVTEKGVLSFYGFARDITEFKRVQQELAESELMFRTMIEESSDLIIVVDRVGTLRYLSPSVARMLGFSANAAIGHDIFTHVHEDDVGRLRRMFEESIADPDRLFVAEYRYRNAANEWRTLEMRGRNLLHKAYIGGILVNIRDITEQKALLDEIKRREELYRLITENVTDIIWVVSLETLRFMYVSPSVLRMRGVTVEEALVEPLESVFLPEEYERVMGVLAAELEAERSGTRDPDRIVIIEAQQYRKDRSIFWVELRASFVYDDAGRAYAIQGSTRDIEKRKEIERSLAEYREHLEELVAQRTGKLNESNAELRREIVEHLRDEERLRAKNERMNRELDEARRVQQMLLPAKMLTDSVEISYRYNPLVNVGGDFLSFTLLQEHNGVGVFIGDVAGHGVSAALYTFYVRSLTDRVCRRWGGSPKNYMSILSAELIKGMKGNYLTGIYGTFFPAPGGGVAFTFAKGGHPYPIMHRRSSGETTLIIQRGVALGLFEGTQYDEQRIDLARGDRIYLYTDGMPETFDSHRNMLDYEGFLDIVRAAERFNQPLEDTLDYIMVRINQFRGSAPIDDDMLIIGVEVRS
ncbi:MAG TPA: PAS domain S-box protein [Spirochaetota bacterium]|nr:PAS domain S-box protein [Spirochaetota bacterium]